MSEKNLFEFLPIPQLYFGLNQFEKIGQIAQDYGTKILVVASESALNNSGTNEILTEKLTKNDFDYSIFFVKGEPEIKIIDEGVKQAKSENVDIVLSIGGGSVIDAGKAISGLVSNSGETKDYMEVIGSGKKITKKPLSHIAVPTTAGTGTEVTKNAVILSQEDKLKASIRSPLLIPEIAIIDPELMVSLPKEQTASCGLDALTQLIESYTSNKAQPMTDSLAILGIERAIGSLIRAFVDGEDRESREDLAFAALLSGICLANAGLGAVHGFAGPIGGMFNIPHGVICGALLAPTLEQNISKLLAQVPYPNKLSKYVKLGEMATEQPFETVHEAVLNIVGFTKNITKILEIPKLSKFGLKESDFEIIIEKAKKSSSMRYNPVELSDEQLVKILTKAL